MAQSALMKNPVYLAWFNMKRRCDKPGCPGYKNYGARGITYQASWKEFKNFEADMGPRPDGYTLERKNNELGYSKENCTWADYSTQNRNRRVKESNISRLSGVTFDSARARWVARYAPENGKQVYLYQGKDFFEACCARKSAEATYGSHF